MMDWCSYMLYYKYTLFPALFLFFVDSREVLLAITSQSILIEE